MNVENKRSDIDYNCLLTSPQYIEQKAYWHERLERNFDSTKLSFSSVVETDQSESDQFHVPFTNTEVNHAYLLTQGDNLANFILLVAGAIALLYRYLDQDIITILAPVNESSISGKSFNDAIYIISHVTGRKTFRELMVNVGELMKQGYLNQDYPRKELHRELPFLERDKGSSLTNIVCYSNNLHSHHRIEPSEHLIHFVFKTQNCLEALIEYNPEQFSRCEIERLGKHYQRLIEHALAHPDTILDELPLLELSEIEQQLYQFNSTQKLCTANQTIHELFEQQVAQYPNQIAAECEEETLTYQEMNEQANKIAHAILAKGVSKGKIVALLIERSCRLLSSILGVLKVGCVFVMVDPSHPSTRIVSILKESTACLILSQSKYLQSIPGDYQWLDVGQLDSYLSANNPNLGCQPDDIAYLIFTSGSTRHPKGVLVQHKSFVNRMEWLRRNYSLGSQDASLQKSPLSFDPSICEMLRLLPVGGKVCFLKHGEEKNAQAIVEAIQQYKITIIDLVPSSLIAFIEYVIAYGLVNKLSSLRWVFAGAEILHPWISTLFNDTLYKKFNVQLINTWGATETTVDATWFNCSVNSYGDRIPVGRPIDNVEMFVVSRNGNLMPLGMKGELYVGGICIASGYLNLPEINQQRFVHLPILKEKLLFKTGDYVRWLSDGNIDFLRRVDNQLKVRGIRIEPTEIESALLEHPQVQQAIVRSVASLSQTVNNYLVAYVIPVTLNAELPTTNQLKGFLQTKLPHFFVPDYIYVLERFPLTLHEKINFDALPTPRQKDFSGSEHDVAQINTLEKQLIDIWQELIDICEFDVTDHFFEIGGNSLTATQFIARVCNQLSVKLSLKVIFERPTIRSLAEYIQNLEKDKSFEPILPVKKAPFYHTSHAQKRIWVLSQFEDASEAYNIPFSMVLSGGIEQDALQKALDQMICRHEVLRTSFTMIDGDLVQIVNPFEPKMVTIEFWDIRQATDKYEYAHKILIEEHQKKFDLEQGSLFKVGILQLECKQLIFFLTIHHIIADAWSIGLMIHELFDYYNAAKNNKPLHNNPLAIQYKDYSAWHNKKLEGKYGKELKRFWETQFAGDLPTLNLPTDFQRPDVKTYRGQNFEFLLDAKINSSLKQLSRTNNSSLFITLLTSLNILLYRYTRQREIIVGTAVAGRDYQFENQLGCYVNSLALRTRCEDHYQFVQLLNNVREHCLQALEHQIYPLDLLITDIKLPRAVNHSPLFDVMLVLQNAPSLKHKLSIEGVVTRGFDIDITLGKLDLIFTFIENDNELLGQIQYNTDLFTERRIQNIAQHFIKLISLIIQEPTATISSYDFLSESEKKHLLKLPSNQQNLSESILCLHQFVELQAAITPERIAVVYREKHLTYQQLNEKANQLAFYLRDKYNIHPDDIVAFLVDRSELLIVIQLAILKAGAAFLPIDFSYPADRIQFILDDSCPKLLLVDDKELIVDIEIDLQLVVYLNELNLEGFSSQNPSIINTKHNLAYVIYTSGSTGLPKGVLLEHGNISSLLTASNWPFEFQAEDVWVLFHSVCFDFSIWEIYVPLSRGSRLIILPQNWTRDTRKLVDILVDQKVTILCHVPSAFASISSEIIARAFAPNLALRYVIFGGEVLNPKGLTVFKSLYPQIQFVNGYGITETTIFSTFKVIDEEASQVYGNIGSSISNQSIYLLDENLDPVTDGVIGEIFIGGSSVARGYQNQPELTASKFLLHPDSQSVRLYCSGDMARRTLSGDLIFLGRKDSQVKLRGFRVELEEIRNALLKLTQIHDCLILDQEDKSGSKILVAYLKTSEQIDISTIQSHLVKALPSYMIPARFVILDKFPLNSNGKIDRSSLLQLGKHHDNLYKQEKILPSNLIEQKLADIWEEILERQDFGVTDDFFALGGHSLKVVQLVSRIQESFGKLLDIGEVFMLSTIRQLSELVIDNDIFSSVKITPIPKKEYYAASLIQKQFWMLEQFLIPGKINNVPKIYEFHEAIDVDACCHAIYHIIDYFEILRTTFCLVGEELQQKIHEMGYFREAFKFTDLSLMLNFKESLQKLYEQETYEFFNLSDGPLFKFHLVKLAKDHFYVLFSVHHIIWDGWSFEVLIENWKRFYQEFFNGITPNFQPLQIQFKDFAEWYTTYLQSPQGQMDLDYWINKLEGRSRLHFCINSRENNNLFYARSKEIIIEHILTSSLKQICRTQSATLFMGLQAIYKVFIYFYTGQNDITVGTPTSIRLVQEFEKQPGPFINILVLRDTVSVEDTFIQILERVKFTALQAYSNPLISPELISRGLGHSSLEPLFDVGFTFQSQEKASSINVRTNWIQESTYFFGLTTTWWLDAIEIGEQIILQLAYQEAQFSEESLEEIVGLFRLIISAIIQQPNLPIKQLHLMEVYKNHQRVLIDLDLKYP
jgi:amino acid adenylation domain-containing protein